MNAPKHRRIRVLFVAECVTLAHFARPVALAGLLPSDRYEVHLAADERYLQFAGEPRPFVYYHLPSVDPSMFARALEKGNPVYDAMTLRRYVEDDLVLIDRVKPDVVIGDFRLSLAVSAPLSEVPYVSLINAYWSPYAQTRFPVPQLLLTRLLGVPFAQKLFDVVRPAVFIRHAAPLNKTRSHFGLAPLKGDLRHAYSWADYTLYPDIAEAFEMAAMPSNHRFLGPVLWSPTVKLPDWWSQVPDDRPVVYLTLGSSGSSDLFERILTALGEETVYVIGSKAGARLSSAPPRNAFLADYLPGDAATRRADLVICNGGSLTTYQAVAVGVPVLGIPSNLDQHLNMLAMQRLGVCGVLRAEKAVSQAILESVRGMLAAGSGLQRDLGRCRSVLDGYDSRTSLVQTLTECVSQ